MLGGAAVHFSLAASFFTEVRPVGPVGDDFGAEQFEVLESRGVITDDIERVAGGQILLLARPLRVRPQRRPHRRHPARRLRRLRAEALARPREAADTLFLANIQPDLQRRVRAQCARRGFAALDSMNLWIETAQGLAAGGDRRGRLPDPQRRRDPAADRRAEPRPRRPRGDGAWARAPSSPSRASTAPRCSPRRLLRPARLPARGRPRPDRRRRQLRRRLPRLPRRPGAGDARRRGAAAGDGLRHGARLLQRRGVRHRAGRAAEPRGDRRALRGAARDDQLRAARRPSDSPRPL